MLPRTEVEKLDGRLYPLDLGGFPMAFAEDLKQLAEQVRKRQVNVKGEEAAKQALILPFLSLLGFDIYDPTIVQPEFVADFAKKASKGPLEKVDYALQAGGVPIIFMECKAADTALPNHGAQLAAVLQLVPFGQARDHRQWGELPLLH